MWHAKPSKAYAITSQEGIDNIRAFYEVTSSLGYTKEATAGMLGNAVSEGGLNPWRWQSDTVSSTYKNGYGLFQYTPASGYLYNYGKEQSEFAPNLSVMEITEGAKATDAIAQIKCIAGSGKFFANDFRRNRAKKYVSDYDNYESLDSFKTLLNIYKATVIWLCYFESPATVNKSVVESRYNQALACYTILDGDEPQPDPPSPEPDPPSPAPTPTPQPPSRPRRKLPVWIYSLSRRQYYGY